MSLEMHPTIGRTPKMFLIKCLKGKNRKRGCVMEEAL
jgi:hypothetical protein